MLIHIVRHNETIENILDNYHVSFDEVKTNNLHITDFKHLKGGMKLKIPFLTEETKQVLQNSESFISDYYPTIGSIDKTNIDASKNLVEEAVLDIGVDDNTIDPFFEEEEAVKKPGPIKKEMPSTPVNQKEYLRPISTIPVPYKRKAIYPHYNPKSKENNS